MVNRERFIISYKVRDPTNRKTEKAVIIGLDVVGADERLKTMIESVFRILVKKTKSCFEEGYVICDVEYTRYARPKKEG